MSICNEQLEKLKTVLKELWDDDDSVPEASTSRCCGLDWFSSGVKDNVVAHIMIKIFGLEEAKKLLQAPDLVIV